MGWTSRRGEARGGGRAHARCLGPAMASPAPPPTRAPPPPHAGHSVGPHAAVTPALPGAASCGVGGARTPFRPRRTWHPAHPPTPPSRHRPPLPPGSAHETISELRQPAGRGGGAVGRAARSVAASSLCALGVGRLGERAGSWRRPKWGRTGLAGRAGASERRAAASQWPAPRPAHPPLSRRTAPFLTLPATRGRLSPASRTFRRATGGGRGGGWRERVATSRPAML